MRLYRFFRFILSPLVRFVFPAKIFHKENIPTGKSLMLANHYSAMEIPVVAVRIFKKEFHALSKKELYKNKLFSWFLHKFGGIPVDRDSMDPKALKECISVLSQNKCLYMCPEGTRNKSLSKEMLPLKHGAAIFAVKTKSPITPVLFYNKTRVFRKTYLIIGKPFTLEEFYLDRSPEMKEKATAFIAEKFTELRVELDDLIENCKKGKK